MIPTPTPPVVVHMVDGGGHWWDIAAVVASFALGAIALFTLFITERTRKRERRADAIRQALQGVAMAVETRRLWESGTNRADLRALLLPLPRGLLPLHRAHSGCYPEPEYQKQQAILEMKSQGQTGDRDALRMALRDELDRAFDAIDPMRKPSQ